jgi:hypothetical protein
MVFEMLIGSALFKNVIKGPLIKDHETWDSLWITRRTIYDGLKVWSEAESKDSPLYEQIKRAWLIWSRAYQELLSRRYPDISSDIDSLTDMTRQVTLSGGVTPRRIILSSGTDLSRNSSRPPRNSQEISSKD